MTATTHEEMVRQIVLEPESDRETWSANYHL